MSKPAGVVQSLLLFPCTWLLACLFFGLPGVAAAGPDCEACHPDIAAEPVKHQAVAMGCPVCHAHLDTADIPHRSTGPAPHGLTAEGPELCNSCHGRTVFEKKKVHAALLMGCTTCHDPHASKNPRLLVQAVPDGCFTCHDRSGFARAFRHGPADSGKCLLCHDPHASDQQLALLKKPPVESCLSCHRSFRTGAHLVAGIRSQGHPMGIPGTGNKRMKDPLRKGKPFYCGSCHDPHSADSNYLVRFAAASSQQICGHCHRKEGGTTHLP